MYKLVLQSSRISTVTKVVILLVCLPQIYVHPSPYALLITKNALKKIITTVIFSINHQPKRTRLPPSFMLMRHRFVRRNFIGHHGWNGQESTNQLWQHISHMKPCISCFIIWCRSALCWNDVPNIELYDRVLKFLGVSTTPQPVLKKKNSLDLDQSQKSSFELQIIDPL